jgi:hypothetical protein
MNAKESFTRMSNAELSAWWAQYGCATQAAFYPGEPRRSAEAEMRRRGIDTIAPSRAAEAANLEEQKLQMSARRRLTKAGVLARRRLVAPTYVCSFCGRPRGLRGDCSCE